MIGHYIFDGVLVTLVWSMHRISWLKIDTLWIQSFGEYAEVAEKGFKVLITLIIGITAFYRMRREINRFRKEKKNKREGE